MGLVIKNFKKFLVLPTAFAIAGILGVIFMPQPVAAEAGPGGGGGSSGCASYNYSTCTGAVWRYYKTTSNAYNIKNVGPGYTTVTNCGSFGGFFAYVLVNRYSPNDENLVRSWKIGPVDGDYRDRSEFFGGWTRYYLYSTDSDPLPTNPGSGMYSWYSAKKAFELTRSLGQNSGYSWDGGSELGWFCYKGLEYNLTPTITGSPTSSEGGQPIGLDPSVSNAGPTGSAPINWRITHFTVPENEAVPGPATNTTAPVQFYSKPGNNTAQDISTTSSFPRIGVNTIARQTVTLPDLPVGTRVCYVLSLNPYSHTSGSSGWRHSAPFCVMVAKKPKIQIHGSDLIVGKNATSIVSTPSTTKSVNGTTRVYGSWGEYAAIASGIITGFGSGSGYSGGNTNTTYCAASYLTFTNSGTSTCAASGSTKGGYALTKSLPDIAGRFTSKTDISGNAVNVVSAPGGVYGDPTDPRQPAATITVSATGGGVIAPGKSVIILAPNATVNITSNIVYSGAALTRASDIPQVVIIANNINIDADVERIDAWLVATGTNGNINTCRQITNPSTQLNATVCNRKLTVNGPVVAKHLYLYRTAGSDQQAGSGNPAEVFNLRPDAYLWATAYSASAGKLQTVSTKELPPRF